jgi:hypothetical protein
VFEAHLGGQWAIFDATRMSDLDDLVRITSGRDAKDVAFATIHGPATMTSMNQTATPVRQAASPPYGRLMATPEAPETADLGSQRQSDTGPVGTLRVTRHRRCRHRDLKNGSAADLLENISPGFVRQRTDPAQMGQDTAFHAQPWSSTTCS